MQYYTIAIQQRAAALLEAETHGKVQKGNGNDEEDDDEEDNEDDEDDEDTPLHPNVKETRSLNLMMMKLLWQRVLMVLSTTWIWKIMISMPETHVQLRTVKMKLTLTKLKKMKRSILEVFQGNNHTLKATV